MNHYGIEICNPCAIEGFSSKIEEALNLLARYSPNELKYIQENVICISSAPTSGAAYWKYTIDIARGVFDSTVEWIASVLVHETHHIYLRRNQSRSNSATEELECIALQIQCLRNLRADSYLIEYLESQDGNHFLQQVTW